MKELAMEINYYLFLSNVHLTFIRILFYFHSFIHPSLFDFLMSFLAASYLFRDQYYGQACGWIGGLWVTRWLNAFLIRE
jgi:hypothetical protein